MKKCAELDAPTARGLRRRAASAVRAIALVRWRRWPLLQPSCARAEEQREANSTVDEGDAPVELACKEEGLPVVRADEIAELEAAKEERKDLAVCPGYAHTRARGAQRSAGVSWAGPRFVVKRGRQLGRTSLRGEARASAGPDIASWCRFNMR